jgi:hypothetical protein
VVRIERIGFSTFTVGVRAHLHEIVVVFGCVHQCERASGTPTNRHIRLHKLEHQLVRSYQHQQGVAVGHHRRHPVEVEGGRLTEKRVARVGGEVGGNGENGDGGVVADVQHVGLCTPHTQHHRSATFHTIIEDEKNSTRRVLFPSLFNNPGLFAHRQVG